MQKPIDGAVVLIRRLLLLPAASLLFAGSTVAQEPETALETVTLGNEIETLSVEPDPTTGAGDAGSGVGGEAAELPRSEADTEIAPDEASAFSETDSDGVGEVDTRAEAVTRFELGIEMQTLAEEEDYAAAAALADDYLRLTESQFGAESIELADATLESARVQSLNAEYLRAEANVLQAIDLYQAVEGPFTDKLIEPYVLLGDNYDRSGDYVSAISAYEEARTVSRRVHGLLNMGQLEILDRMSTTAESMNELAEARELQTEALTLVERRYEPHSPEMLEALYRYALWLRDKNLFTAEREQYIRADRIIREHYGPDSVLMVRHLRERANSYRIQGAEEGLGISGLRDALDILEQNSEPHPLMKAEVLRDLGDWEVAFSRVGTDGANYLRSWNLLGNLENAEELRRDWYEDTAIVFTAPLSQRSLTSDPNAPAGHVLIHFTVDTSGRTNDVVVVESEPPGLKDDAVARQFRQSRFRPMIREGQLVPARRAFDIQFRYIIETGDED